MKLEKYEIDSIKSNFYIILNKEIMLLFGSRINDSFQGGDIDLYLGTLNIYCLYEKVYFHHLALFVSIIIVY